MADDWIQQQSDVWASTPRTLRDFDDALSGGVFDQTASYSRRVDQKTRRALNKLRDRFPMAWKDDADNNSIEGATPRLNLGTLTAEIIYWNRILSDHAILLLSMISKTRAKELWEEALDIRASFADFATERPWVVYPEDDLSRGPTYETILPDPIVLTNLEESPDDQQTLVVLGELNSRLGEFILSLLEKKTDEWIGYGLYDAFLMEIFSEGEYFKEKVILGNPVSYYQEVLFWGEHSKDHALLSGRMLDPSEEFLTLQENEFASAAKALTSRETLPETLSNCIQADATCFDPISTQLIQLSSSMIESTEKALTDNPPPKSVAPPLLLTHSLIEYQYGSLVLQSILPQRVEDA
jgi:hypothetical protein